MPVTDAISFQLDMSLSQVIDILLEPDSAWTDKQLRCLGYVHKSLVTVYHCWHAFPELDASPYLWLRSFDMGCLYDIKTPLAALTTCVKIILRLSQLTLPESDCALLQTLLDTATEIDTILHNKLALVRYLDK